MASQVDSDKSERKVWIVRVPPYVARQWHEAIERSRVAPVDEDVPPEVLGQVAIENGIATTLQVPDAAQTGLQTLFMNPSRDTVDTSIISYEPGPPQPRKKEGASAATVPSILNARVDGVVHKRYDAAPVRITGVPHAELGVAGSNPEQAKREAEQRQRAAAAMQAHVDAAYLQNSRKRLAAAAARPKAQRKLELLTDMREMRELAANVGGGDLSKEAQRQTSKFDEQRAARAASLAKGKRVRMERDELEQELFKKFGEQPHWHFTQLQKELDQPVAYLKEILNEMASQIKRGPNKDLWELKKHLVTGGQNS